MEAPIKYATGEARCANCNNPLPAVEAWPGRNLFFCEKEQCQDTAKNHPNRPYVDEGEKPCSAPGCTNFAPAGSYDPRHKDFVCSAKCWRRLRSRKAMGNTLMICACGCGREFRAGTAKRQHYFYSRECAGRFKTAQTMGRMGQHLPTFKEYVEGFAQLHYRHAGFVAPILACFAEFLNEHNIADLATVTPKIITEYLTWGIQTGRRHVGYSVSVISTFYHWMIAEGRSKLPNPVIVSIHRTQRNPSDPRPYTEEEMEYAWAILEKRGNNRLGLAMALGEEAGLRISEIANVRLPDIDQRKQRVFVRRPTKNGRTRTVPFGEKTLKYLELWLKERDPDCGHDHLLHGPYGFPTSAQGLRNEFCSVLTKRGSKDHKGTDTNPDGFEKWSTHRLRHTMASRLINGGATQATIQAVGGWRSEKAMAGYTRIDPEVIERGYRVAMKRSKEFARERKPARRISLSEYVNQRKAKK